MTRLILCNCSNANIGMTLVQQLMQTNSKSVVMYCDIYRHTSVHILHSHTCIMTVQCCPITPRGNLAETFHLMTCFWEVGGNQTSWKKTYTDMDKTCTETHVPMSFL